MTDREDNNEKKHDNKKRVVIEFDRGAKSAAASAQGSGPVPDEPDAPEARSSDPAAGDFGENLSAELARVQSEKDELMQTMMRRQADFENYRKRIERDRAEEHRRGVTRLIEELIPVLDAFERALKAHDDVSYEEYRKGLVLIYEQLWSTLARQGLERIPAAGAAFDPHFHQAIERVETSDYPDGAVIEVFQDGYLFHGRVLRPSIVRVAVHPGGSGGDESVSSRHRSA